MPVKLTESLLRQIIREEIEKQGANYKMIVPQELLTAAEDAGQHEDADALKDEMKTMKHDQVFHVDPYKCKVYIRAAPGQDIWNHRLDISQETCAQAGLVKR